MNSATLACVHERSSAPRVRAITAGAPELHVSYGCDALDRRTAIIRDSTTTDRLFTADEVAQTTTSGDTGA